ncbi:MAG TPA: hypothetical protein VGA05_08305 [Candidatus Bathyarchaeia archaeon]
MATPGAVPKNTPLGMIQSGGNPGFGGGSLAIMQELSGFAPGGEKGFEQGWANVPQSTRSAFMGGQDTILGRRPNRPQKTLLGQ